MDFRPGFTRQGTDDKMSTGHVDYELHDVKSVGGTAVRVQETNADEEYKGSDYTYTDQQDMRRMGKKQELRRNFRFTSILGFVRISSIGNGTRCRSKPCGCHVKPHLI